MVKQTKPTPTEVNRAWWYEVIRTKNFGGAYRELVNVAFQHGIFSLDEVQPQTREASRQLRFQVACSILSGRLDKVLEEVV